MNANELTKLAELIASGLATDEEILRYNAICRSAEAPSAISEAAYEASKELISPRLKNEVWNQTINKSTDTKISETPVARINWVRNVAAAVLIVAMATGTYLLFKTPEKNSPQGTNLVSSTRETDSVLSGSNKAILTLGDGRIIELDSVGDQLLAEQGNVKVIKLPGGIISYNNNTKNSKEVLYNTITTPRGGQYHLILEDGTHVWLNAVSSLRFPTFFQGNNRSVELTGEGYFEVAHNAAAPFQVKLNKLTVEVLGTHLNINSYQDERAVKTTLLEGSLQVKTGPQTTLLVPGEQLVYTHQNEAVQKLKGVNIAEVIAWKDGRFRFYQSSIEMIMRQVSRWYDVEVEYKGAISTELFSGDVSRQEDVAQLLDILRATNTISLEQTGNKIIVTNLK